MITVLINIVCNWILMGVAVGLLFVLCYYFAVTCEKISDKIASTAKYFRERFNQP